MKSTNVERIPVEVSGIILEHLETPRDLLSAITASRNLRAGFEATRDRTLKSVISNAFGEDLDDAIAVCMIPRFEKGDMANALPGSDNPEHSTWAEKAKNFWDAYRNKDASMKAAGDGNVTIALYKLHHVVKQYEGNRRVFQRDVRLSQRGLLLSEMLVRLCVRPWYQCIVDYVCAHDTVFHSNGINMADMTRAMENLLKPADVLLDFPPNDCSEILKVLRFYWSRYTRLSAELDSHIIRLAAQHNERRERVTAKKMLLRFENLTIPTTSRLEHSHISRDQERKIAGWQLGIGATLGQAYALGLPFLNKIDKMNERSGDKLLIKVASTLNFGNRNIGINSRGLDHLAMNQKLGYICDRFQYYHRNMRPPAWLVSHELGRYPWYDHYTRDLPPLSELVYPNERVWPADITEQGVDELLEEYGIPVYRDGEGAFNTERVRTMLELFALAD